MLHILFHTTTNAYDSLIPNLSYVSEAAAYVLDCQLRTHLVPYTDVVWLSSKSFHYPFWDRRKFNRKKRPLPAKPGSFQVFLKGFKDANVFLREHPWPDQYWSGFRANDTHRNKRRRWTENCRPSSAPALEEVDYSDDEGREDENASPSPNRFMWTEPLKQSFREELEKLVILDYIMRNTDRGLDNWMIKLDYESGKASIVSDPIRMNMEPVEEEDGPRPADPSRTASPAPRAANPYKSQKPMDATTRQTTGQEPAMAIGAIDNSLSWPWKHPDAWRRYFTSENFHVITLLIVVQFPLRLAFPPCRPDWQAILAEDKRSLSTPAHIDRVVDADVIGVEEGVPERYRLQGKDVRKAAGRDEGPGVERCRGP